MYISEWIVVTRGRCSVVVSWSKGAFVVLVLIRFLVGAVSRNMSGLFAVEAKSFPKVLASFFIAHRVDCGRDDIDVHSVWVMSLLRLIISSLISWSGLISSSIDLSEFVGVALLSSCRPVRSFVEG